MSEKIKVCVIGAGAAGLCAARHLAGDPDTFEFVLFEKSTDVGGTWTYVEEVGRDNYGLPIHSSMYKNLRTNLPKEIMSFPDFPEIKTDGTDSCLLHSDILKYLKDYSQHFQLHDFIKFETLIERVKLVTVNNEEKWKVDTHELTTSKKESLYFDAVMICNGHYFDPYIPSIRGLDKFNGEIIHSHNYRIPEAFLDKKVIVLGASSSGIDIAFELIGKASHVYLSHNNSRLSIADSDGFTQVQGIDRFENDKFILKDKTAIAADVLMLCTGYKFSYPFLDDNCGISVDDNYVSPLYKHLINITRPTMCFIGIPTVVVPFPMFHMQVQYFLSVLKGKRLPSKDDQIADSNSSIANGTVAKRHAHKLSHNQWAYNDDLAQDGQFPALPDYYRSGYEAWWTKKRANLRDYKKFCLVIDKKDDGSSSVQVVDPRN
ncbi:flavin-containing monooxygenase FMO GS-OX-like 4 [Trichogramma pretiosum]|uniref:flavin-containing monooxygenase FMO GS-OX-like 4 n=1 Tax=Trichogramma pretiosum TaxID=7493 RepID=UPI0006C9BA69|nr:flavin-containing monooxygenase FMO GS-OX-like 4 [Trichogramma pretiosum]